MSTCRKSNDDILKLPHVITSVDVHSHKWCSTYYIVHSSVETLRRGKSSWVQVRGFCFAQASLRTIYFFQNHFQQHTILKDGFVGTLWLQLKLDALKLPIGVLIYWSLLSISKYSVLCRLSELLLAVSSIVWECNKIMLCRQTSLPAVSSQLVIQQQ